MVAVSLQSAVRITLWFCFPEPSEHSVTAFGNPAARHFVTVSMPAMRRPAAARGNGPIAGGLLLAPRPEQIIAILGGSSHEETHPTICFYIKAVSRRSIDVEHILCLCMFISFDFDGLG